MNTCTADTVKQWLTSCLVYYQPGIDTWGGLDCRGVSKLGPGTIEAFTEWRCAGGVRRYRTVAFGSVKVAGGEIYVSRLDKSRNRVYPC